MKIYDLIEKVVDLLRKDLYVTVLLVISFVSFMATIFVTGEIGTIKDVMNLFFLMGAYGFAAVAGWRALFLVFDRRVLFVISEVSVRKSDSRIVWESFEHFAGLHMKTVAKYQKNDAQARVVYKHAYQLWKVHRVHPESLTAKIIEISKQKNASELTIYFAEEAGELVYYWQYHVNFLPIETRKDWD